MENIKAEFRFLYAILNPITEDRITVGLIHWDGSVCRFAYSLERSPYYFVPDRFTQGVYKSFFSVGEVVYLRTTLKEYEDVVIPDENGKTSYTETGLLGRIMWEDPLGLLKWSDTRTGKTTDPEQHFKEIADALHLNLFAGKAPTNKEHDYLVSVEQGNSVHDFIVSASNQLEAKQRARDEIIADTRGLFDNTKAFNVLRAAVIETK